ncbi:MAG: UDP-N-acetylmuramoyl-tripeptide--D-alanyl-D-alanine ligase [Erysipelotrichaceae bacterium]|jgi:UDP-N-acetylmuramoyl-tripeptide--D-alanyl-D-alanine ligase
MINYSLEKIAQIVNGELIGDGSQIIRGVHYDSRLLKEDQMFAPFKGANTDGHLFVGDLFSKGIKASFWQRDCQLEKPEGNLIIVDDVLVALQTLARYYRMSLDCRFIGITGSSGKTSTKDIVAAVLAVKYKTFKTVGNYNNKLGVPLTLINMDDDVDCAVIEMGIDDFGIMEMLVNMVEPDFTVITSIGLAHAQQFLNIDNIVEQKCLINSRLKKDGCCYYSYDAYGIRKQLKKMGLTETQIVSYGFENNSDIMALKYSIEDKYTKFTVRQYPDTVFYLPILGRHQVLNSLAAIAIGQRLDLSVQQIQDGFNKIELTPHRMQVKIINDAVIIDDTYNSNPSSLAASLETVIDYSDKYQKIVVIGDILELGENSLFLHANMANLIDFRMFDKIYLVGQQMRALHEQLKKKDIVSRHYNSALETVDEIKQYLKKGNVIFFKASNGMKFAGLIEKLEEDL